MAECQHYTYSVVPQSDTSDKRLIVGLKLGLAFTTLVSIVVTVVLVIGILTKEHIPMQNAELHASTVSYVDEARTVSRVTSELYGVLQDVRNVTSYTLLNDHMQVSIINYGGIITQVMVPDKDGKMDDIVLGYDSLKDYVSQNVMLGAIVGRYANLIAGNRFRLDGEEYVLAINNDVGIYGSSSRGFSKRLWESRIEGDKLVLAYNSADGEDGFPGNGSGDVNSHLVRIITHHYTPLVRDQVPTGEKESVDWTMYDMRSSTLLGPRLPRVPGDRGFDINFAFGNSGWDKHMASVTHAKSGRTLDVYSTEPGMQINTGYHLNGIIGKGGVVYKQYGGLLLEAQHYPNSPNEVYLSCTNHPIQCFRDCISVVNDIVSALTDKGRVIIMGDFNTHLKPL